MAKKMFDLPSASLFTLNAVRKKEQRKFKLTAKSNRI
jgi:hypothetical protein